MSIDVDDVPPHGETAVPSGTAPSSDPSPLDRARDRWRIARDRMRERRGMRVLRDHLDGMRGDAEP